MDIEAPSRDHLVNSRQLAWDRACTAPGWADALDHLLGDLEATESRHRARRGADRDALRSTLGALVLDLYGAAVGNPEQWLAYSRNANDYGGKQRYVLPRATAKSASTAADYLAKAGLIEHRAGSYTRTEIGGRGYRSRMRALPALVELLEGRFEITPQNLCRAEWTETVRLKAAPEFRRGPKRLMGYTDTAKTNTMREQIADLNAFIGGFQIDLEGDLDVSDADEANIDQEEEIDINDRSSIRLYRVFNNGRWDHGGRFYGGWWQALPKSARQRLLIDGEETVELDYRALHPRLCYHLEGFPLGPKVDPYTLQGLPDALRPVVKTAFNQLLNITAGTPKAPKGAVGKLPRGLSYKALVAQIEAEHAPISRWFRAGRGVELQHIDSEMALSTLDYLRHRGICCLPVHDSFIIPRSAEFVAGQTMAMAYHGALSTRTAARSWPVIAGWTSTDMEQAVISSLP